MAKFRDLTDAQKRAVLQPPGSAVPDVGAFDATQGSVIEQAIVEISTPAAHQANSAAADVATLKNDFNALLAKLQAAGLMA